MKMNKISILRQLMTERNIAATIIPSTDPHGSEYVAEHWQARRFLSGFTGSAGTLVVTAEKSALWTDSRYFLQASEELVGSDIELMKEGLPQTPSINEWILSVIEPNTTIAIDAKMFSINEFNKISDRLAEKNIGIMTDCDLVSEVWENRPPIPQQPIAVFEKSGRSCNEKLKWLRERLHSLATDAFVITALDEIAWLFNIRGSDIEFNPVAVAYAFVTADRAVLFVDDKKQDKKIKQYFSQNQIETIAYDNFFSFLKSIEKSTVGIDFRYANYEVFKSLSATVEIKNISSPIIEAKSVKNRVELAGFRRAMIKDGVALVRFCRWLQRSVREGKATELAAACKLHEYRAEQSGFVSDSFETISAYQAHGAVVHYAPTEHTDEPLRARGLLLLDSGGQYTDGTTDITRTIVLGRITAEQKRDFTLVLKGVVALSKAIFPEGTRGAQLDVLARQYLWQNRKNFGHGTGHGVGHYLCVHEGPQSIRMQENPQPLLCGMVTSNEPAVYADGKYGIRHENLIAVKEYKKSAYGRFLCFETLTLFPFDKKGIDLSLLTTDEIEWLNAYHTMCYKKLSPHLNTKEKTWLKRMTAAI